MWRPRTLKTQIAVYDESCIVPDCPKTLICISEFRSLESSKDIAMAAKMQNSIIVPIYNEVENIPLLVQRISQVMDELPGLSELILVDDGSEDGSADVLDQLANADERLVIVHFRRNYGQTAAMQAGLEQARGEFLVTLDGDLQNEPNDIPQMLAHLEAGYDLVHGWRKERHDTWLTRKLPSRIANGMISRITRFPIHDLGCTLKAMRRDIADELELYGEMHRFIPILAHWRGAKCLEMITTHHPRRFGKTKYGLSRTTRVVLDLLTVKYMLDYYTSPMKLFGRLGLGFFAAGTAMLLGTLVLKLGWSFDMSGNPLLVLGSFLCIVSVQLFSVGLLGEANTRLYYRRNERRPFTIRRVVSQARTTAHHHGAPNSKPSTVPFKKSA
jgi:glycosyltransferase involved in cell wall biosynthesis